MSKPYEKAYTEVLEILKFLPRDEYDQIPKEEIAFYESHQDKNYSYHYDPTKGLNEQPISREANAVLVTIFQDFFASEVQKEKINQILTSNEQRTQIKEQQNPASLNEAEEEQSIVKYKVSFFAKLRKKIRAILQVN